MKGKTKMMIAAVVVIMAGIYYYAAIPAINIHSSETWFFIMIFLVILAVLYLGRKKMNRYEIKENKVVKGFLGVVVVLGAVYLLGTLLSSPVVNAKKYQKLMTVKEGEFAKDVEELSFDKIPLLDKDTAALLGDRKMGSMVDMVSQFEADDIYSQINYKGNPVRVTPLKYASLIKWFTNQSEGIPSYIRINMANQSTELVKLKQGMKYTTSDHFNRNIYRHLRFAHPTYIYGELSFEIDENGDPYWIAPVKKFNIGLFGGETVGKVVICNAVTGKTKTYDVGNVPQWVDRVYSADLLVNLFDYYGTLKHGFFNSVLSQKDCLETTDGYNYLALNDDVWMYTGVTSVNGDQSNVGFVLANQRTMETKYYKVEGATESSAMSSAEGQVQHLGYKASFPSLINISGIPTYIMVLKDNGGLVKMYALVDVEKYNIVATGTTQKDALAAYNKLLAENGLKSTQSMTDDIPNRQITVADIKYINMDETTYVYITDENGNVYKQDFSENEELIFIQSGDKIKVFYQESDNGINDIISVER